MNKKNGIGKSKSKQSRRQEESAPEMPVGRAYAVESLTVGKVLTLWLPRWSYMTGHGFSCDATVVITDWNVWTSYNCKNCMKIDS